MPKKAKAKTEAETTTTEAKPVARGGKTAAVKAALKIHSNGSPKEIAELLQADGWDIKAQLVSVVKSNMKRKKKAKAAPTAPEAAAPALPKDAVSLGLLQKAKKLAAQLGGIKEAKAAIDALSQLMD